MNKNMSKLMQTLFVITILAMIGAFIIQMFFPEFLGENTSYGLNKGWQREISIWNLGFITILIATLFKGDKNTIKIVALGASIIGIGFGTNHLFAFISDPEKYMSLVGALENYFLVALLIFDMLRNRRKHIERN